MIFGNKVVLREKRLTDARNDYSWETDSELAELDAAIPVSTSFSRYLTDLAGELRQPLPASCRFAIETRDGKVMSLDARPSDAIALAVRSHSPVFVSEVVMMQAKLVNSEKDAEETKKFKEFIENLKPEDFTKFYKQD